MRFPTLTTPLRESQLAGAAYNLQVVSPLTKLHIGFKTERGDHPCKAVALRHLGQPPRTWTNANTATAPRVRPSLTVAPVPSTRRRNSNSHESCRNNSRPAVDASWPGLAASSRASGSWARWLQVRHPTLREVERARRYHGIWGYKPRRCRHSVHRIESVSPARVTARERRHWL